MDIVFPIIGSITLAVGAVWLLIEAFRISFLWGIACIFIPLVSFIFAISYWDRAKKPFIVYLTGLTILIISVSIS